MDTKLPELPSLPNLEKSSETPKVSDKVGKNINEYQTTMKLINGKLVPVIKIDKCHVEEKIDPVTGRKDVIVHLPRISTRSVPKNLK